MSMRGGSSTERSDSVRSEQARERRVSQNFVLQEMDNLKALKRLSIGQLSSVLDPDLPNAQAQAYADTQIRTQSRDYKKEGNTLWVPASVHPEVSPNEWMSFVASRSKRDSVGSRLSQVIDSEVDLKDASAVLAEKRKSQESPQNKRHSILELSVFEQHSFSMEKPIVPVEGVSLRRSGASSRRQRPDLRRPSPSPTSPSFDTPPPAPPAQAQSPVPLQRSTSQTLQAKELPPAPNLRTQASLPDLPRSKPLRLVIDTSSPHTPSTVEQPEQKGFWRWRKDKSDAAQMVTTPSPTAKAFSSLFKRKKPVASDDKVSPELEREPTEGEVRTTPDLREIPIRDLREVRDTPDLRDLRAVQHDLEVRSARAASGPQNGSATAIDAHPPISHGSIGPVGPAGYPQPAPHTATPQTQPKSPTQGHSQSPPRSPKSPQSPQSPQYGRSPRAKQTQHPLGQQKSPRINTPPRRSSHHRNPAKAYTRHEAAQVKSRAIDRRGDEKEDMHLPYAIPAHQVSDRSYVMMYHRFPLHIERAIYRFSHMKLANPRRPLREQVLLSNFMYAYLNLINQGYQQQMEQQALQENMGSLIEPLEEYESLEPTSNVGGSTAAGGAIQVAGDYEFEWHEEQHEHPESSSSSSSESDLDDMWGREH